MADFCGAARVARYLTALVLLLAPCPETAEGLRRARSSATHTTNGRSIASGGCGQAASGVAGCLVVLFLDEWRSACHAADWLQIHDGESR